MITLTLHWTALIPAGISVIALVSVLMLSAHHWPQAFVNDKTGLIDPIAVAATTFLTAAIVAVVWLLWLGAMVVMKGVAA